MTSWVILRSERKRLREAQAYYREAGGKFVAATLEAELARFTGVDQTFTSKGAAS